MSFMHSITLEEAELTSCDLKGLNKYHTLYLFHSKNNPGLFEISEQSLFLKERKTIFKPDYHIKIINYSTDTPILILFDGRTEAVLMPNICGELVLIRIDHGLPTIDPDFRFIKIDGLSSNHQIQFLEYSP